MQEVRLVDSRSRIENPRGVDLPVNEVKKKTFFGKATQHRSVDESTMSCATITLLLVGCFAVASGQFNYNNFYAEKPGSCPPPLSVDICSRSCFADGHCESIGKCCPTSCGGTVCSRPVTMRRREQFEKPGVCPAVPTGRWVCSSTCSTDGDCRGTKKCCKNRCGAFACQRPDIEVVESIELPFGSPGDVAYDNAPNGNPFVVYNN